jgi:hypothetical protein
VMLADKVILVPIMFGEIQHSFITRRESLTLA